MKRLVLSCCCLLSLAACTPSGGDGGPAVVARPQGEPEVAAAAVKTDVEVVNGPNMLKVVPGHVFACDGRDRAESRIAWKSTDPAVGKVAIRVQGPEDPQSKLFTIGGSEGEAVTGNWVVAGTAIIMLDEVSGRELARHTVTSSACN